jgi:hypothetical protein
VLTVVGLATADNGPPPRAQNILGIVASRLVANGVGAATSGLGSGQLRYHSGPVMHTNTTYAIYWSPSGYSFASSYISLVNRYFTDVATDSGKSSNVYYTGTQYYDGAGHVAYSSKFGGSTVDTNAYPASGCSDSVSSTSVCLSDSQLRAEIKRVAAAKGWGSGPSKVFFLFTPRGIGSCYDSADCAFSQYCAYHSWIGSGSTEILYANQPYTDTVPSACDAKAHPNASPADPTINVASHEHNEAITDPDGSAWYDLAGYEDGDKCAWIFGSSIGSTSSGGYNQLINGHPYELQMEWSNYDHGCILTGK